MDREQRNIFLVQLSQTILKVFYDFPHLAKSDEGQIAIQLSTEGAELIKNQLVDDDFVDSYHLAVVYLAEAVYRYVKMN